MLYSHHCHHKGNRWWNTDPKLNIPKSRLAYCHEESFPQDESDIFYNWHKKVGKFQLSLKLQKAAFFKLLVLFLFFYFQTLIKKITLWFKHIAFLQPAVKALKWEYFCPECLWVYHLQGVKGSVAFTVHIPMACFCLKLNSIGFPPLSSGANTVP